MNYELIFKIILICLYSLFTIIRVHFSRQNWSKRKNTKVIESKSRLTLLQVYIILTVIIFFLYVFLPKWFYWSSIPNYQNFIKWMGVSSGIFSIVLFLYVHLFLGKNFSYTLQIFENHSLITTGPYRFIRHPMYSAFLLFHSSIFLVSGNWFIGIIWIVGLIIVLFLRISKEEKMLIEAFGKDYQLYIIRTGMFLPPLFKLFRKKTRELLRNNLWAYRALNKEKITNEKRVLHIKWMKKHTFPLKENRNLPLVIEIVNNPSLNWNGVEETRIGVNEVICKYTSNNFLKGNEKKNIFSVKIDELKPGFSLNLNYCVTKEEEENNYILVEARGNKEYVSNIKTDFENLITNLTNYQIIQFGP